MRYVRRYRSALGDMLIGCDEQGLTDLCFEYDRHFRSLDPRDMREEWTPVIERTAEWLDIYFSGREPEFTPPLHPGGSDFRRAVGRIMLEIPYGGLTTYGDVAARIARERGLTRMSAQAVGGAVGHNPVAIVIPCHRVVGAGGDLTGYGGGLERKIALLKLEGVDTTGLFLPKRGR